jgi:hypothetical protein
MEKAGITQKAQDSVFYCLSKLRLQEGGFKM